MATQNFINECKNRANANRLGKFTVDNLAINQSNYLTSMEFKDSCYVNNTIIGSTYTKSVDIKVLNLPVGTELIGQTITPEVGVRYSNNDTEYVSFDNYVLESSKDEQTASNTAFTGMNGGTALDKEYICSLSFENGATHTIYEFYQDACYQLGIMPTDISFDNGSIVMTGNPFQNHEPIRTVIEEVERVSCTIAKFDWTNQTVTLGWLSNQIDYTFNTSDYSTLEGSMEKYGPLNVIILGNSQLEGENVTMTDDESVELNGEHQIMIDAPYFLYTEELRTQAIQAIYDKLDGLTYYDLKLTTPYGKPFLKVGDKIRINTNENQTYDTYVLSHTFTYDGAFTSVIESPALTSEEQKVKNEKNGNSLKERMRRTEVIVDKTTGDISAITEKITEVEDEFNNYYTIEQTNTLVQNAETGVTNTFSEAGGNNVFRNTGLWFETQDANNPYEYWNSVVERVSEDKAANRSALKLKATTLYQEQSVPNGNYTVSFKYRKLINAATCSVIINGETYPLTATTDTEIISGQGNIRAVVVSSQTIKVQFVSDTDDACLIYDIMVNAGRVKLAYSQNQNETTTDTVNISKGITITSTLSPTTFKANADGIRIYANSDLVNEKTKFTDKGIETEEIEVKGKSEISGLLIQEIGSQTWLTKI